MQPIIKGLSHPQVNLPERNSTLTKLNFQQFTKAVMFSATQNFGICKKNDQSEILL